MDTVLSFFRDLWDRLQYPLRSVMNLAAILVGLANGGAIFYASITEAKDEASVIYAATLSFITLFLLVAIFIREVSVVRRRRIASSVSRQADAFERLQTVWSVLHRRPREKRSLEIARSILQEVLTQYAFVYGSIAQNRCRFCIKLIEFIDGEYYVYTLARDRVSARENRHDDAKRQRDRVDPLNGNSDFVKLWSPELTDEGFFYSKDLAREKDYSSTSLNYKANIAGDPYKRSDHWQLNYRSTIVWPIRQETNPNLPNLEHDRCIGFLAVDTARPGVLRIADAAIGEVLARGLYPVLEAFADVDQELTERNMGGNGNAEPG